MILGRGSNRRVREAIIIILVTLCSLLIKCCHSDKLINGKLTSGLTYGGIAYHHIVVEDGTHKAKNTADGHGGWEDGEEEEEVLRYSSHSKVVSSPLG